MQSKLIKKKMEINFETVRIGNFRKNIDKERILKANYDYLKNELREFIKTIQGQREGAIIEVDIVIPAKGSRISITLDAIRDNEVKQLLRDYFPDSIYRGDYSILLRNCLNRPYFPFDLMTQRII